MRWIRIYVDQPLQENALLELDGQAARHLTQVLRLRPGDRFSAFNGDGFDYPAQLDSARKQNATAQLLSPRETRPRPARRVVLGQALIKGERMDWAIQKAVELGVTTIAPLTSERTEVRLNDERADKRLQHWRGVVTSACEQCGRADVPEVLPPQPWHQWAQSVDTQHKIALIPEASASLGAVLKQCLTDENPGDNSNLDSLAFAIGPEGGWSDFEAQGWVDQGFVGANLGRIILRAETVGVAVLGRVMLG